MLHAVAGLSSCWSLPGLCSVSLSAAATTASSCLVRVNFQLGLLQWSPDCPAWKAYPNHCARVLEMRHWLGGVTKQNSPEDPASKASLTDPT